jgi:ATP-dependent DNA helicase RecQ
MDPHAGLRRHFGFDAFRPGQEDAVRAALAGRDALVVMPTGAGKSLCYQLPALMRDDLTLVVSPLVSLMADQVQALERRAPGRVGLINAQQDPATNRETLDAAASGSLRLLYVAPERFSAVGFTKALGEGTVGLFVVDEAHCVSHWGHDFRPDYLRLAAAARQLGAQAVMASTATATPRVASDVAARLGLRDPVVVTTGFDRPNLGFAVVPCASAIDKERRIATALGSPDTRPAIVYAGTRAGSVALAEKLGRTLGVEVTAYHAGLERSARAAVQRRFMGGEVQVVVATNAFGMGIDKANVRTVCHATVPASLEAYYQEAGRAGRDGDPARCLLFAERRDKGLHSFFIQRSRVEEALVMRLASRLAAASEDGRYDVALRELTASGCDDDAVRTILGHLARAGVVEPVPAPVDRVRGDVRAPFDGRAAAACRTLAREAERVRWAQYRAIWGFVEGTTCRRAALLRHFGDSRPPAPAPGIACCDVCAPGELAPAPTPRAAGKAGDPTTPSAAVPAELDDAIVALVREARPSVGRTRAVEILRGGRSRAIVEHSYDGLPFYASFAHLTGPQVMARVDALLAAERLRSTGGRFPKLQAVAQREAA